MVGTTTRPVSSLDDVSVGGGSVCVGMRMQIEGYMRVGVLVNILNTSTIHNQT